MAEGKFVVSAQNKVKEGLDGAKKDLLGFQDAAEQVGNRVKNALTVTAIAAGLVKLGKAAFECFEEFGEADRRVRQLGIALGGNESSLKKATNLIDDMRKMSLASKDDIEGLVTELASLGKSDIEIDKLTRASANLSNITGKDLTTSYQMLAGAQNGQTKALKILLPEVTSLTKEQLAAGGAADLVNRKFTELSTTLAADNIPQKLKNLKDSWGDMREELGKATAPIFSPIVDGINQVINRWTDAMRAADNYNKIASKAGGFSDKINLKQQALDFENARLLTMKSTPNYVNNKMSPADKAALAVQEAKVTQLQAEITDLKKAWRSTPVESLIKPGDIITATAFRDTDGGVSTGNNGSKTTKSQAFSVSDLVRAYREAAPFQGAFSASDLARGWGNRPERYAFNPDAMEFGEVAHQFAEDLSVAWAAEVPTLMNNGIVSASEYPEEAGALETPWVNVGQNEMPQYGTREERQANREERDAVKGADVNAFFRNLVAFTSENWRVNQAGSTLVDVAPSDIRAGARGFIGSGGGEVLGQEANLSWLDKAGNKIADFFNDAKKKIEPVFDKLGKNIIQPVVNKVESSPMLSGIIATVGPVFAKIGAIVGPLIDQFGGMLKSVSAVAQILDYGKTIVSAMFEVLSPVLNELLTPIVGILNVIGSALGDMLVPILEALTPVIQALATAFVWLYNNVIVPVGNLIYSMMATVWNGIAAAINFLLGWLGVSLEYMDTQLEVLDKISLEDVKASGESTVSDSTSTTSASYASQSITVNIYQQGILIGDDGMATLARTVRDEIDYLAYKGR